MSFDAEAESEKMFRDSYYAGGIAGAFYVAVIGGLTYAAFAVGVIHFGGYGPADVFLRCFSSLVLLGAAAILWLFPEFVLRWYQAFVGLLSFIILSITVYLIHFGSLQADYSLLGAAASLIFALLMHYSFLRLPVAVAGAVGIAATALFFLGASYEDVDSESMVRSVIYCAVCNFAGVFLRRNEYSRERSLFRARDRIRRAEDLARSRAVKAEAEFAERARLLNAIDHDLRQPLAATAFLLNSTQRHLDSVGVPDVGGRLRGVSDSLRLIQLTLDHIRSLSAVDRVGARFDLEVLRLGDVFGRLRESLAIYAQEKGVRFDVRDTDLTVASNLGGLWQVLSNMVGNAIKYSASHTRSAGGAVARVRAQVVGNVCVILIGDNGPGIRRDDLTRIWTPYSRLAPEAGQGEVEGVGLGLYLVKQTVDRLPGHRVSVRSRLGRGTSFRLELPLHRNSSDSLVAEKNDPTELSGAGRGEAVGAYVIVFGGSMLVGAGDVVSHLEARGAVVDCFHSFDAFLDGHSLSDRLCDFIIVIPGCEFLDRIDELVAVVDDNQDHKPSVLAPEALREKFPGWRYFPISDSLRMVDVVGLVESAARLTRRVEGS